MGTTPPRKRRTILSMFFGLWMLFLSSILLIAETSPTREVVASRNRLNLVRSFEVQAELSLEPRQIQEIAILAAKVDLPLWKLRDLPIEQSNPQALPLRQQLQEDLRGVLYPDQIQRLDQLVLRMEGWRTLQLPSVAGLLDLTDPQKDRFADFMAGFRDLKGKSLQSISSAEHEWIRHYLTAAQREKLGQLLGKPFDFSRCKILEVKAPEIAEIEEWINSPPLKLSELRGKVVIVNFWTYGCINCIRNLPHYRKWHAQLPRDRAAMVAFHTPETEAEFDVTKIKRAAKEKSLDYPIAVDNQKENWSAWGNSVWPSVYLIDKQGYVRYWWYGELNWQGAAGEAKMLERVYQLMRE